MTPKAEAQEKPSKVRLIAYYWQPDLTKRAVNLGSWPLNSVNENVDRLTEDPEFLLSVTKRLRAKGVVEDDVVAVYGSVGKKGLPVDLQLNFMNTNDETKFDSPPVSPSSVGLDPEPQQQH